jgi:hypothetical protein
MSVELACGSAYRNREQAREGKDTSTQTERFQRGFTMLSR